MSLDAGAGARMAVSGAGNRDGGAPDAADGSTAPAAHPVGKSGADLDSGARAGSTSDSKTDGGPAAEHDAALAEDSGSANDSDAACASVAVHGCNPVTNQGCLDSLSMQCAVDRASTSTGYCIFYSGQSPMLGGDCLNTGVTESCPPTFTCVDNRCRKLCLCGAECETGQCCKEPLDSTGFKVCGDC
jgi:hypothetical protein